jgi:hypothetical protein
MASLKSVHVSLAVAYTFAQSGETSTGNRVDAR